MKERRLHARQKSFLQGRTYFNNRHSSVDCLVRDSRGTQADLPTRVQKLEAEVAALKRFVNELRSEIRKRHGEVA